MFIVTGAAGHLGNTIVKQLVQDGHEVRALILPQERGRAELPEAAMVYEGDVLAPETLKPLFEDAQDARVIHCAGIVSIASRFVRQVWDVNVEGTKHILDKCREAGVGRAVYVSSVHAIPEAPKGQTMTEPEHFDESLVKGCYAKTKARATALTLSYEDDFEVCTAHPSGICGPGDYGRGHITQLLIDYCSGALRAGLKQGGYDFVDVRDVARGVIECAKRGRNGEGYILSNRYFEIPNLLELFHEVTGLAPVKSLLPMWLAKATAPLSECYYRMRKSPPLFTPYSLYTLSSNAAFSHAKATAELGYTTRPFVQTVADTFTWLSRMGRIQSAH